MEIFTLNERFSLVNRGGYWEVHELVKNINPKTKELAQTIKETFHPTVIQCLTYILDKAPKSMDTKDIQNLRTELRSMMAQIESFCKEMLNG